MSTPTTIPSFTVALPEGWRSDRGADGSVRAVPERPEATDPTRLTVTAGIDPSAGGTIEDYAAAHVQRLVRRFDEALPIEVHHHEGVDGPTLDLTLAFQDEGADLTTVERHVVVAPQVVLVASATTTDHRWPTIAGTLSAAVRSLRLTS
jgi:hypothetical protein